MRSLLILFLLLNLSKFSLGQFKSGAINLSISGMALSKETTIGYNLNGPILLKESAFTAFLGVNYFIKPYFALGIESGINKQNTGSNESSFYRSYTSISKDLFNFHFILSPKIYVPLKHNFYLPIEFPVAFTKGLGKEKYLEATLGRTEGEFSYYGFYGAVKSGLSYILKEKLEFNVSFNIISFTTSNSIQINSQGVGINIFEKQLGIIGRHHDNIPPILFRIGYIINNN